MHDLPHRGLRCIAYDQRGCGCSDQPWTGYDYDTLSDDLQALLEHLDVREATLVGHSMGGGVVTRYLARRGASRVARAVEGHACACPLRSWMALGWVASRRCTCRLTFARVRDARAPSPRTRRACICPAVVGAPCRRRSPLESAEGNSPQRVMRCLGVSPRVRSPSAVTVLTIPVNRTPRRA
jgi:pimeloyl-ACP methyl ester carboxylesterase